MKAKFRFRIWIRKVHKWLALVVGLQLFLWTLSGLFMTYFPIQEVRSEHLANKKESKWMPKPEEWSRVTAALAERYSADLKGLKPVVIGQRSLWWVEMWDGQEESSFLFDHETNSQLMELGENFVREIAQGDYAGTGRLSRAILLDSPTDGYRGPFPVYEVEFTDPNAYRIYISPTSGKVMARRSELWRWYDFLWGLHIMDYQERENFNNSLVQWAAFLGLVTSLSGIVLIFYSFNRRDFKLFSKSKGVG
ncbi:MAG: PepSY domain-containing protein [Bdellovibrionaceae bacterium]|nr:PepSY domain-containing protein [Bdellovibrionales bacterium]MCB9084131.1 PepSY domain-containing protein [Pseudobdellovibrionaceae bacterium]